MKTVIPFAFFLLSCLLIWACTRKPTVPPTGVSDVELSQDKIMAGLLAISQEKIRQGGAFDTTIYILDFDADGLPNDFELEMGTDPYWPDSDNDRLPDGFEANRGSNPLVADPDAVGIFRQSMAVLEERTDGASPLLVNSGCLLTRFNATTCTATCVGTCLFGTTSCYWSWDPIQYAIDKLAGGPCPGWACHCP